MTLKVYSILVLTAALPAAEVDFARQVHPILTARCGNCHTGPQAQAGLDVNTRTGLLRGGVSGPAVIAGKAEESLLVRRLTGAQPPRMPLAREPLSAQEIELIKRWIAEGAKGPQEAVARRWVAPFAPRMPEPPSPTVHPVDAFLKTPEATIADNLFARRVYLDLWGLLPTPEQLAEFLADRSPNKREALIDRLLNHNTNYAGHWISFWNDLLRNDDGVIYHGERKPITSWLRQALETNMPYDRFVAELLNPAPKTGPEGFILGITWRGEIPASERPPLQAAQNSAQTFLGVNLKCNVCHDSFISHWKLKDAYALASFFSAGPLEIVRCDVPTGQTAPPGFLFKQIAVRENLQTLEERRAEAARLFTAPENGRLARTLVNRYWKRLFGRGLVEPVDDMDAEPYHPDLLDWLASDFAGHGYDLKHLLRRILTSRAYQLPAVYEAAQPGPGYVFRGPHVRRLTAEQFADAVASLTGEWRYKPSPRPEPVPLVREWELKSSPLTRALGRPLRDQVVTERASQPTTLEALELVNGVQLAEWLHEGARRLVDGSRQTPVSLFDSGLVRRNSVKVDIPIQGASKLWLLVENVDSYDPSRVIPMWRDARLRGRLRSKPLAGLLPEVDLNRLPLPSRLVVDLRGKRFRRFQAVVEVHPSSHGSDIGPAVRFYVFDREPEMNRLVRVRDDAPPVARPSERFTPQSLMTRLYRHALARDPEPEEARVAMEVLGPELNQDRVEDLLWMILMSPEFQFIR